jgi:poly-gamma-glutamate synthesis protein (capsule biosynthesis protein)
MIVKDNANHITFPGMSADVGAGNDTGAQRWTLFAVGDICVAGRLDATVADADGRAAIAGPRLAERIGVADVALGNLEGAIRGGAAPVPKSGPPVAIDAATPRALAACGFGGVTLANNHSMDFGATAMAHTARACREAGLATCGAGENHDAALAPALFDVPGGIRLAVIGCCEKEFGVAEGDAAGTAWCGHADTLARIAEAARQYDVVVVLAHGGVEEIPLPPPECRMRLRSFIDAGASVVVGHHPHVPQPWEQYGNGLILYSLGNFVFDYPDAARYPKTEWGLAVEIQFLGRRIVAADVLPISCAAGEPAEIITDAAPYLEHLRNAGDVLAKADLYAACWQEMAVHLWDTRYRRWLQRAAGAVADGGVRANVGRLMASLRGRFGKAPARGLPPISNPLMLLNLMRNESHRWSIQTALEVESGAEPDRRTEATARQARALLAWTDEAVDGNTSPARNGAPGPRGGNG